jgi:hypothetical protein
VHRSRSTSFQLHVHALLARNTHTVSPSCLQTMPTLTFRVFTNNAHAHLCVNKQHTDPTRYSPFTGVVNWGSSAGRPALELPTLPLSSVARMRFGSSAIRRVSLDTLAAARSVTSASNSPAAAAARQTSSPDNSPAGAAARQPSSPDNSSAASRRSSSAGNSPATPRRTITSLVGSPAAAVDQTVLAGTSPSAVQRLSLVPSLADSPRAPSPLNRLGSADSDVIKQTNIAPVIDADKNANGGRMAGGQMTKAAGTGPWMSPEVFRGDVTYGPAVDVYVAVPKTTSLCSILFHSVQLSSLHVTYGPAVDVYVAVPQTTTRFQSVLSCSTMFY